MTKVELFELIRREHFLQGKSVRELSRTYRVHRRMVRQALSSAIPPPRKPPERQRPKLGNAMRGVIDSWLEEDLSAPRKQRHTARRIFERLCCECGYQGAESTVRAYVGKRRRGIGLRDEVRIPRAHEPGEEAEVDWYKAEVDFPEGRRDVNVFVMRACYSGREFHWASPRHDQQALLEAHVHALEYFGGVFARIRYDNLPEAVAKVLRGRRRVETERFVALRSHYLFASEFCRVGKAGAPEKGGAEGAVGRYRRSHLTPVPKVRDFRELNELLLAGCLKDDERRVGGRPLTVAQYWEHERAKLRPLPAQRFPTEEVSTARVDGKSRVQVRTNWYSVPTSLVGLRLEVRVSTHRVELYHRGRLVARHARLDGRYEQRLDVMHYLEVLRRKPGALKGCLPLSQARCNGAWPACFDELWRELRVRHGEREGTVQLVEVLLLCREALPEKVRKACEQALELGCYSADAVAMLLRHQGEQRSPVPALAALGHLTRYERPLWADLSMYDALYLGRGEEGPP